jgi:hypothetical protein
MAVGHDILQVIIVVPTVEQINLDVVAVYSNLTLMLFIEELKENQLDRHVGNRGPLSNVSLFAVNRLENRFDLV